MESSPAIRLTELVTNHTEFSGHGALYIATIVMVMNKDKYEAQSDDLRANLDAASGQAPTGLAA